MQFEVCKKCGEVLYSDLVFGYSIADVSWTIWCPNGCKLEEKHKIDPTCCKHENEDERVNHDATHEDTNK